MSMVEVSDLSCHCSVTVEPNVNPVFVQAMDAGVPMTLTKYGDAADAAVPAPASAAASSQPPILVEARATIVSIPRRFHAGGRRPGPAASEARL